MTRAELQQAAIAFGNAHLGKSINVDNAYGAQCWDWAAYYANKVPGCPSLPTGPVGGARECFEYFRNPLPQYFDRIPNDPNDANQLPVAGDIICWGDPYGIIDGVHYGHIAVVRDADTNGFTSFDQNWGGMYVRAIRHDWTGVLGWLRPKTDDTPAAPAPSGDFVTVQAGWGLSHVAQAAGYSDWSEESAWARIASLNGSNDWQAFNNALFVGQQVRVKSSIMEEDMAFKDRPNGRNEIITTYRVVARRDPSEEEINAHMSGNMFSLTFGFDAERAAQEKQRVDTITSLQATVASLQKVVDGDKLNKTETEKQLAEAKKALEDALAADVIEDAAYEQAISDKDKEITELKKGHTTSGGEIPNVIVTKVNIVLRFLNFMNNLLLGSKH